MKKLHSFAFCALITPILTLGASPVLAQQAGAQNMDKEQHSTQRNQGKMVAGQSDMNSSTDGLNMRHQNRMKSNGFMDSVPQNGMHVSDLVGAEVKTSDNEDVGTVSELIIDESGQIVAIIVGVGGFLGMAEKDVAIGWDDVTRLGEDDEHQLMVDLSREQLSAAPKLARQN